MRKNIKNLERVFIHFKLKKNETPENDSNIQVKPAWESYLRDV